MTRTITSADNTTMSAVTTTRSTSGEPNRATAQTEDEGFATLLDTVTPRDRDGWTAEGPDRDAAKRQEPSTSEHRDASSSRTENRRSADHREPSTMITIAPPGAVIPIAPTGVGSSTPSKVPTSSQTLTKETPELVTGGMLTAHTGEPTTALDRSDSVLSVDDNSADLPSGTALQHHTRPLITDTQLATSVSATDKVAPTPLLDDDDSTLQSIGPGSIGPGSIGPGSIGPGSGQPARGLMASSAPPTSAAGGPPVPVSAPTGLLNDQGASLTSQQSNSSVLPRRLFADRPLDAARADATRGAGAQGRSRTSNPAVSPATSVRTDPEDLAGDFGADPPLVEDPSPFDLVGSTATLSAALSEPQRMNDGSYTISALLHPPALGRIEAVVSVDGTKTSIAITAHTTEGHDALASHLDDLQREFAKQGRAVQLSLANGSHQGHRRGDTDRPSPKIDAASEHDEGSTLLQTHLPTTADRSLHVIL